MIQQFLMQFTGALNRRRAYAATHPMVQSAEERLHTCITELLTTCEVFTLGVAKDELLIDGEPHVTKSSYARELAGRLHRRGVGAITFERGIQLIQLSDLLAWLAAERDFLPFAPTRAGGVQLTTIGYDHLVLNDGIAEAEASVTALWRTLAVLAETGAAGGGHSGRVGTFTGARGGSGTGDGVFGSGTGSGTRGGGFGQGPARATAPAIDAELERAVDEAVARGAAVYSNGDLSGVDSAEVIATIRATLDNPSVARRTAVALSEVAARARGATPAARAVVAQQLHGLLDQLGSSNFAPIIGSLSDRAARTTFVEDVADALPVGAVVNWIRSAADAHEQQMSHQILRIMTKLAVFADVKPDVGAETQFRDAARDLVRNWSLADPNPTEHVELLDRIASIERADDRPLPALTVLGTSVVETSRIVQMALELDFAGEDSAAAADSLVGSGGATTLLEWARIAGPSRTSKWLTDIALSEKSVKQLLLTEPVDRLKARALLELLTPESAGVLLDVLEQAEARGTRMIVRQRLTEFGPGITPVLLARLQNAPWFLVRNILTVLQEIEGVDASASADHLMRLLDHPQVQVRTEAVRVLVQDEKTRDAALRRALRDDNERVVVLALQSINESADTGARPSPSVVAQLMGLVDSGAQSDPVRARAVRAVGTVRRNDLRDWLLHLVSRRTPFLRRLKLVEPTQTAATALLILQRTYAADPAAAKVLQLAARVASDTRWQVREAPTERVS